MKAAQKFFHRYIFSTIGILALFFAINVLLVASYFVIASLNGVADSNFPMDKFSQHITMQKNVFWMLSILKYNGWRIKAPCITRLSQSRW